MSSTRVNEKPSFAEIEAGPELQKLIRELQKIKPGVEVSIEGHSEVAKGRITDWNEQRKLFTVKWEKKSEQFDDVTNAKTGLRAFFKSQLFTTQLVFKTTTVRRLEDGTFHYRIPTQIYKQQRRGSLRVPIHSTNVVFHSAEGKFKVLDLSEGGARLKTNTAAKNSQFTNCELNLAGERFKTADFSAQITFRAEDQIGVRFAGLNETIKTRIKQFLVDALKLHYEQEW
jgi:c-di-GMP-binding flagellar brake protein YcgR